MKLIKPNTDELNAVISDTEEKPTTAMGYITGTADYNAKNHRDGSDQKKGTSAVCTQIVVTQTKSLRAIQFEKLVGGV